MAIYRKIKHLQVTDTFHVPGYKTIDSRTLNTTNYPGIEMVLCDYGVNCTLSTGVEFLIPFNRIEAAVYVSAARKPEDKIDAKAA